MNRLFAWSTGLVVCGATGLAMGRAPLIDPPTPPPCAADGTCYPKTGEWGYYPGRWRAWPGVNLEPTPSKSPTAADDQVSPELGRSETPPAELEDAAAPPSSPRREESEEVPPVPGGEPPAGGKADSSLPTVPLPDAETAAPIGPTSETDPPPALPRSLMTRHTVPGQRSAARMAGSRPATAGVSTNDPPPAPPWAQSASL
jgi:hypothetical protein